MFGLSRGTCGRLADPEEGRLGNIVFVAKETTGDETRVAASVETVKKMIGLGLDVVVESGAGTKSKVPDAEFEAVGARIGSIGAAATADVVLKVRRPSDEEIGGYKSGADLLV